MGKKAAKNEEVRQEPDGTFVGTDPFDDVPDAWNTDNWQTATALIWKPEPGHVLMGVYDGSDKFTEGEIDNDVLKHFVIEWHTNIRYSFVGGSSFDKMIADSRLDKGDKVRVEYLGKRDTGKEGRRVNLFDVKYSKA